MTIWNALRVALGIFSGKIIYNFGVLKSLRAFQDPFFTSGVVMGNDLALSVTCGDSSPKGRANSPSHRCAMPAPSEMGPLAWRESFWLDRKACGRARSPSGELSRSD